MRSSTPPGYRIPRRSVLFRILAEQAVHGPAKGHSRGPPFSVSGHWRQALQPVKPEGNRTATARAKKLLIVFLTGKGGLLEKLCLGKKIRPGLSLNH